ncbi:MAG: hypothetical protein KAW49_07535, partial [Anaerolineae bacterium]|nr:hypothetical protein [Anaerolineae bacterium]
VPGSRPGGFRLGIPHGAPEGHARSLLGCGHPYLRFAPLFFPGSVHALLAQSARFNSSSEVA